MSILIKGVKMPKCCEICPFNYDYFRCNALGEKFDDKEEINFEMQRLSDCPLVEVPPHGNLIDTDERSKSMNDTTTLSDEQMQELLQDANSLYALYNLIGRGHVSEWDWCFAYMEERLPELIKRIEEQEHE